MCSVHLQANPAGIFSLARGLFLLRGKEGNSGPVASDRLNGGYEPGFNRPRWWDQPQYVTTVDTLVIIFVFVSSSFE